MEFEKYNNNTYILITAGYLDVVGKHVFITLGLWENAHCHPKRVHLAPRYSL